MDALAKSHSTAICMDFVCQYHILTVGKNIASYDNFVTRERNSMHFSSSYAWWVMYVTSIPAILIGNSV